MRIKHTQHIQDDRLKQIRRGRGHRYIWWDKNNKPYFECPAGIKLSTSWSGNKHLTPVTMGGLDIYNNNEELHSDFELYLKECERIREEEFERSMKRLKKVMPQQIYTNTSTTGEWYCYSSIDW